MGCVTYPVFEGAYEEERVHNLKWIKQILSELYFPQLRLLRQVTWGLTSVWRQLTSVLTWQLSQFGVPIDLKENLRFWCHGVLSRPDHMKKILCDFTWLLCNFDFKITSIWFQWDDEFNVCGNFDEYESEETDFNELTVIKTIVWECPSFTIFRPTFIQEYP